MNASELAGKTCVPCRAGTPPLGAEQVRAYVAALPKWVVSADGKRIGRTFTFKDFVEAMKFVNKVAEVAESQGHHPDIHIHWNKVELELWTHAIGGLHENDFVMAAKLEKL
jgi:4a-hydroxytetrahydrobiopterin dehydratase